MSQVNLYGIPSADIYQYWHDVEPFIRKALRYSDGKYESWDIFSLIEEKQMQLWIVTENKQIIGCGVTQILIFPQKKVCQMVIVSGEDFNEWKHFLSEIEKWAVSIGCQTFELDGRRGWERKLKNWSTIGIKMRKNLDEHLH